MKPATVRRKIDAVTVTLRVTVTLSPVIFMRFYFHGINVKVF